MLDKTTEVPHQGCYSHHSCVRVLFGLHGGHLDAFLMGHANMSMRLVDTRHETVAVQAAERRAKASVLVQEEGGGGLGVCFVTVNSRFCNGIPGLATAFADHSFHDQFVLAKPITNFAHRIKNLISWGNVAALFASRLGPDPRAIKGLLRLLQESKRPVIVLGTGAKDAVPQTSTLVQTLHLPTFHSTKYSTTFPHTHSMSCGSATLLALLPTLSHQQPDLILLLSARTAFILGGRSGAKIPNTGCNIAQVDTAGGEIGRSFDVSLAVSASNALVAANSNTDP
ncbi:hypothetical protein T440DRAFT_489779 [Plenodomus tracheiphilus IPT5]|uniref:Uncharacterized protein n=1 Tax=Plenodomus tracheiphilus IPT5 TaxID=1408161 RepID=A0A6A7B889_9PLEO|nr:hypothetical protein T440DRAFT_489779 [Plenodomus tracheiphilus IPT5]